MAVGKQSNFEFENQMKKLMTPWISVSDLMAGLMMVFLFISISYTYQVTKQSSLLEQKNLLLEQKNDNIAQIVAAYHDDREIIYQSLNQQFSDRLQEWQATIDKDTLTFRFNDPTLLFEPGSSKLTKRFQEILTSFWNDYVEILEKHSLSIKEVKIEGHTSTEWVGVSSEEDSYFKNMELSQARTRSTLVFCYRLIPDQKKPWVRSLVTANGMSFSRPIKKEDGTEDMARSRRVEFTIVVDSRSSLDKIIGEL